MRPRRSIRVLARFPRIEPFQVKGSMRESGDGTRLPKLSFATFHAQARHHRIDIHADELDELEAAIAVVRTAAAAQQPSVPPAPETGE